MTWKNTARLPENLCSTIVILKSDVTSNGAKLLSLNYPVVLLKEIKSFNSFRTPSLCYWVLIIKCPSSFLTGDTVLGQVRYITYKRCRMISTVLSATEMEVATYTSWMKLLVLRILIIPSHTLCTIWSLIVKFLAGIVHVFMDNAGSTNKNQYMMDAALEIVQQGIMDYLRISYDSRAHKVFPRSIVF